MASYTYNTVITQIDASTVNLAIPSVTPSVTTIAPVASSWTNQRTSVIKNMAGLIPTSPLPNSYNLTSTVAGMGSIFGDSVYKFAAIFTANGGADDYTTEMYFLITTTIDAGIAAMPSTTPAEIARKAYLTGLGQTIQAAPLTTNLERAAVNALIGVVESYLFHLTDATVGGTFTYNSPDEFEAEISVLSFTYTTWGGWYNAITNTLTNVVYPYTLNFDPNNGGSTTVTNAPVFPDGVYQNYMSVLGSISATDANLFFTEAYELVTTTIDAQIQLFEDNYDSNNTAEAIALAELQSLQTEIAAAFADEDYTLTNSLIAEAQAILANGLSRGISAALTSDADMNVFFTVPPAMPTGTYTNASGTITNTLTGVAFTFSGFPTNSTDLTQMLNSETLGFGADFPDGVYQIVVTWLVDGLLFTASCYLAVTTDWQCCIDKAAGKKCGKLNTAANQARLENAARIVRVYATANVVYANDLIAAGNRDCSGCGCGCS